jgi:hypothetical protein
VGFAFAVVGGPIGGLAGSGGMSILNQGPVNANARLRAYEVEIAYAWVPNRYVDAARETSGSGRLKAGVSGVMPNTEEHLLTGFSFHFGNSDHYLGRVGVHLGDPDPIISWQDINRDDPIQWTVRYLPLRRDPPSNLLRLPTRPVLPPRN